VRRRFNISVEFSNSRSFTYDRNAKLFIRVKFCKVNFNATMILSEPNRTKPNLNL